MLLEPLDQEVQRFENLSSKPEMINENQQVVGNVMAKKNPNTGEYQPPFEECLPKSLWCNSNILVIAFTPWHVT